MSFKARTTFYSLALTFGIFQTIISSINVEWDYTFAPYIQIFAGITLVWAVATWVWISVLLYYNNRPLWSQRLTRASAHFISFTTFAIGWLALFIMMGTQFPLQCDFKTPSDGEAYFWCAIGATSFTISVLLFAFCAVSATLVYISARKTGKGLSANVAQSDKVYLSMT